MNEEYLDGFRKIYSEYSDENILSLLKEGEVCFDKESWRLLQEEAAKRSIKISEDNEYTGPERAGLKERFLALTIDTVIAVLAFGSILFLSNISLGDPASAIMFLAGCNLLFFLKDSTGQGPGKKLMKIRIVNKGDFKKAGILSILVRNLFLCLGIIEVIVIFNSKDHEGLGDKVTGTIVVKE